MTARPGIVFPAAACFALCAFAFANVALAQDAPKADATTTDHMDAPKADATTADHMSDHMAPMKHGMKKDTMKKDSMASDHMAPETPK
jgi:pentapeptide MXKDX repeat protein